MLTTSMKKQSDEQFMKIFAFLNEIMRFFTHLFVIVTNQNMFIAILNRWNMKWNRFLCE